MRLALIAALLLAASATAEPPAPEGAPAATATSPASPHNRPDACEACHTTAGPAVGAVSPGSEEACVGCHPGVEVHPVGIEPRDVAVPDGWPLADGALACSTCHSEPSCDAARSTATTPPPAGTRAIPPARSATPRSRTRERPPPPPGSGSRRTASAGSATPDRTTWGS